MRLLEILVLGIGIGCGAIAAWHLARGLGWLLRAAVFLLKPSGRKEWTELWSTLRQNPLPFRLYWTARNFLPPWPQGWPR